MSEQFIENPQKYKIQKGLTNCITYLFLILVAIMVIIPFYWMILTSLKSQTEIESIPPILYLAVKDWKLSNYTALFDIVQSGERAGKMVFPFFRYMGNTILISLITTAGTTITTILTAFAFARLNFKGRNLLFAILLATMMVPGEIFILTNFLTINKLGWYDIQYQTFLDAILAMTLPFMVSVFYIFYLRQTFKQIPNELYYAAKVDGTSDFKYLTKIMIPIASPTIITIIILNSMGAWSAYIWPALVTAKDEFRLVSNGLRGAFTDTGSGRTDYGQQMA
ncbi:MAG TPA: carbohydrate ABC transporter permease, partial [Candidatus Izemoplasmatales bacterium]|nr:carbohydrate ABC transporter permease [Candidatus Izemoplasmatales bacterium]